MSAKASVEETDSIGAPKLPFTATAVPEPGSFSGSSNPHGIKDLDQYSPQGPPATRKEVWSYYTYYAGNNGIGSFQ